MFNIILVEPEIPPNTGNIIRLCANTGSKLHLVRPLAFELDDKRLRRAGLDYHEWASVQVHDSLGEYLGQCSGSVYAFSTKGKQCFAKASFKPGDSLIFGSETRGLSMDYLSSLDPEHCLTLPMLPDSRSLNLSNTVAVAVYEAWRQNGFVQE